MSAIASIRKDYKRRSLNETDVSDNPFTQFSTWWQDAVDSQIDEVNAMTLCTVSEDGRPNGRIVLLKGYSEDGFIFFTNYESRKGAELAANPAAALVFFWKELERQVRITGTVKQLAPAHSDDYFFTRPRASRISAIASPQSRVVANRDGLQERMAELEKKFEGQEEIPRPPHWGGYIVIPDSIEFWQGRPSRLHDRLLYTLAQDGWKISRIAP